ncbi:MAG: hypothetical protein ACFFFC_07905 [Candidatus Thorarchaeota archaeon]
MSKKKGDVKKREKTKGGLVVLRKAEVEAAMKRHDEEMMKTDTGKRLLLEEKELLKRIQEGGME